MRTLSPDAARRLALVAQGLGGPRPSRVDARVLRALVRRLGVVQIDSVNVLVRAHYLPAFSRLGAYDRALLDDLAYRRRALFEYWGHEASLLPIESFPLFRWRMEAAARREGVWGMIARLADERPGYLEAVYEEVQTHGPLGVSQLSDPGKSQGPWWGWAHGKHALEWLFWIGRVTAADRRNFERIYDVTERVIPEPHRDGQTIDVARAQRDLLLYAARALGVGTASDLADYFRIHKPTARAHIAELVAGGALEPVRVRGWKAEAYMVHGARIPRAVHARALVAPFDPIVWERARTERLFGFRYRIEIYVPAPKRVHGYYVLPFLLGDTLVARADLKADRARGALLVQAVYGEEGIDRARVARELAEELRAMAAWLGLQRVDVKRRGDLSAALRKAAP